MKTQKPLTPAELANVLLQEMKLERLRSLRLFEALAPADARTVELRAELAAIEHLETCAGANIAELVAERELAAERGGAVLS